MSISTSIHAVLTADIVNSTIMPVPTEEMLLAKLKKELSAYPNSFYRGDSFQVLVKEPAKSLKLALMCRALAISLVEDDLVESDIRISIGIGRVQLPVKKLAEAKGDAFILSGRGLDEIQDTKQRLLIRSGNEMADIGFQTIADYLDDIYSRLTIKQAIVVIHLLKGRQPQDLIKELERSKSTIYQLINDGRWPEIERLLQQFEKLNQLL